MLETSPSLTKLVLIPLAALAAHVTVLAIRRLSRWLLGSRAASSQAKIQTLTAFASSVAVFAAYFVAVGFVLREFGISLTAYLASASILGLAISFGSQGLVQDVINGLTVVFSDLIDVGDMVEIAGQVGIVESVGIRFTVLVGFNGARIFVPNRTVMSVINHPHGYVRAYLDLRLPQDEEAAVRTVQSLSAALQEQFPGTLLLPPTVERPVRTDAGYRYVRVKFRIWPGQNALIEGHVRQALVQALRGLDPAYGDWMVAVHYRAESQAVEPQRRLPRPAALARGRR
jgi:small conductance mechanosensitive channel